MAVEEKAGQEAEEDYESDIDDAHVSASRRRAAASDEEEEDESGGGDGYRRDSPLPSTTSYSESDEQGAAEFYDDDDDDNDEDEEGEVYGTEEEEDCQVMYEESVAGGSGGRGEAEMVMDEVPEAQEDEWKWEDEAATAEVEEKEPTAAGKVKTKKGVEPYVVPTTGPFYMHDNRFANKENFSRGQIFVDKKIWYPKDEAVWVHDRFQEINFHGSPKDNAGIMHNIDHGYPKRIKSYNGTKNFDNVLMQSRSYDGNAKGYNNRKDEVVWQHDRFYDINSHDARHDNVQSHFYNFNGKGYNNAPNVYRGKVSGIYQSHWATSRISSTQNNRSKLPEVSSNAAAGKHSYETSTPTPFNSSRSDHQNTPFSQREKARVVKFSKLFSSAVHMAHNSSTPQSYPILRKKACVPSGEHVNAVDSSCMVPIEDTLCSALHSVSPSTSGNYTKYSESYNQGEYLDIAESANNTYCFTSSAATRPYVHPRDVVYNERPVQPPMLPARKAFAQIFSQKSSGTNKIQSHPQTTLTSSSKGANVTTTTSTEPNNSAVLSEVKGHDDMEETEQIFSHDTGDHVLGVTGASGFTLDDTGSTGIPAKLPVMLFRGAGFPSLAMAFPGLVGQQLGGNSEMGVMTWLPILTDATVVLGGTHTEVASPPASPRYHSATKDPISSPSQERLGHEIVCHQNRPRRYSEMSFA